MTGSPSFFTLLDNEKIEPLNMWDIIFMWDMEQGI